MILNKKVNNFVDKVLKSLEPMKKIIVSEDQEIYYLMKDNITFAEIYQNKVYLRYSNKRGNIVLTEKDVNNKDLFLIKVKLSYFWAKKDSSQPYVA